MPKVTLPSPGRNAPCPKRAAWLSPMAARTGMPSGRPGTPRVAPKSPALSRTSGRHDSGTPNRSPNSSLQRWRPRSKSWLRAALEASQAWTAPPVRQWISHKSMVPRRTARPEGTRSSSHRIFGPGNIGSIGRPVSGDTRAAWPARVQRGASGGAAAALPADDRAERLAGRRVPDGDRLALVGDRDADDLGPGPADRQASTASRTDSQYAPGALLDPARAADARCRRARRRARGCRLPWRRARPWSWSSPDRWRGGQRSWRSFPIVSRSGGPAAASS